MDADRGKDADLPSVDTPGEGRVRNLAISAQKHYSEHQESHRTDRTISHHRVRGGVGGSLHVKLMRVGFPTQFRSRIIWPRPLI